MAFIESPRYPEEVSPWLVGGEEYMTDIVMTQGGHETRNQVWSQPLRRYRLSSGLRTLANVQSTKAFFRAVNGRANGFRIKDWYDYSVTASTGVLGAGYGTGMPTYQLGKAYISGAVSSIGKVVKPVAGHVAINRNTTPVTVGTAAGNCAIDTTTGIITFVADASSAASAITTGATTTITLAVNPGTLVPGQKLYIAGFTGADSAILNGKAHSIISITGAFDFTLDTVTTGKTITVGTGTGYHYPQASDALNWVGEFDIPVRFDMDWLQTGMDTGLMIWDNITMIELRI